MRHYVTVADAAFLPRLKVLHASMLRHCRPFTLHVLPWDAETTAWSIKHGTGFGDGTVQHQRALAKEWIQRTDLPGPPRSLHERMWSARADLTALLLESFTAKSVCQLDADMIFFSSPEEAFAEIDAAAAPAGVMPHYFASAVDGRPGITAREPRGDVRPVQQRVLVLAGRGPRAPAGRALPWVVLLPGRAWALR